LVSVTQSSEFYMNSKVLLAVPGMMMKGVWYFKKVV